MLSPSRKELKEEDSEEDTSSNDEWNKTPRVGGDYQVSWQSRVRVFLNRNLTFTYIPSNNFYCRLIFV